MNINKDQVLVTDEPHQIIDQGKLEGALMRPQNSYYYNNVYDVVTLSVNLMISIADAHAFLQGNKRTGFAASVIFAHINGYDLVPEDDKLTAQLMAQVIDHQFEFHAFESYIRSYTKPL